MVVDPESYTVIKNKDGDNLRKLFCPLFALVLSALSTTTNIFSFSAAIGFVEVTSITTTSKWSTLVFPDDQVYMVVNESEKEKFYTTCSQQERTISAMAKTKDNYFIWHQQLHQHKKSK